MFLVDDNRDYVAPSQHERWLRIEEFAHPYMKDHELERLWGIITQVWQIDVSWSGD